MFFCFKQKTVYGLRISDWSSDVCSADLVDPVEQSAEASDARRTRHIENSRGATTSARTNAVSNYREFRFAPCSKQNLRPRAGEHCRKMRTEPARCTRYERRSPHQIPRCRFHAYSLSLMSLAYATIVEKSMWEVRSRSEE